ncbi:MAG: tetratricopeptide repeat protein [bacterium]
MSAELMFGKKINVMVTFVALMLLVYLTWGCGASRQSSNFDEQDINLDELLGEENTNTQNSGGEESEVLRLLGITPVESTVENPQETNLSKEFTDTTSREQADELEQELLKKDREISLLRSELSEKESKIDELQSRMKSQPMRGSAITRFTKSGEPSPEFKSQYQYAINQFNAKSYQEALNAFSELLLSDPNNSLSDNCQYWIGECYYGMVNYNQAITEFEKVFSFPNSNKSDDAQLKLGLCYLKLGDKQQARAEFDRLLSNYPDSEYVALAQRYIGRL